MWLPEYVTEHKSADPTGLAGTVSMTASVVVLVSVEQAEGKAKLDALINGGSAHGRD